MKIKIFLFAVALFAASCLQAQWNSLQGPAFSNTDPSARIDIGTDTSQSKLHVLQSSNAQWAAHIENLGGFGKGLLIKAGYNGNDKVPVFRAESWNNGHPGLTVLSDGNVGIGTYQPASKLDIRGNLTVGNQGSLFEGYNSVIRMNAANDVSASIVVHDGTLRPKGFYIRTGNDYRMKISEDGSVGIGTLSPASKLDVRGNLTIGNQGDNSYIKMNAANNVSASIGVQDDANLGRGFYVKTGDRYRMKINEDGLVGIGTSQPVSKLDVRGNLTVGNQGDNSVINMNAANGKSASIGVQNDNNDGFYIKTGGEYRMHVNQNGNVAIGNLSRFSGGYKLGVDGKVYCKGLSVGHTSDNSGINFYANNDKNAQIGVQDDSDAGFYIKTNGRYRMHVNQNGNVTIGNTAQVSGNYKLAVDGKIKCRELRVDISGWADFVFEKEYSLRPLEEVEQFIRNKGHLPDVPSETEVLENGADLGKMDAILLQKIEELTLYMIDMKKENQQLREEVQALKEK